MDCGTIPSWYKEDTVQKLDEKEVNVMALKAAIWVHGNVAEVELRKRLRSISEVEEFGKPIGWGKY